METVLLLPGNGEDLCSRDYRAVLDAIDRKGYEAIFCQIDWQDTTIDDWLAQIRKVYAKYDPAATVLAGFSFGAMVALGLAAERPPSQLWCFSLAAFFAEDLPGLPSYSEWEGHERLRIFRRFWFQRLAQQVSCLTHLYVGQIEMPEVKRRSNFALGALLHSRLITVPDVGHDVSHPKYIDQITQHI